ncbi:GAF and ANTAR domain-containing protein [Streptomyces sp. SID13031]|uniref:GAF and ANTAR domain-containing protein n=1 Tax=Streptomyces sp. SID13031 TaxID=2706046 RepID=UPI0013C784A8|nr:GAF and ANTAR domain-containing protein [Streptomyces sp. SID13031]NEA36856.1 GAF and ANTAR domain-containing protein [Streptomyces sp. SID13031]
MSREQRLAQVFVELADTLVDDFDVIDLLHTLCECSVELLQADAAGLILADQRSVLHVMASTTEEAALLELFVLQNDEGPCLDCYSTGEQMVNIDLSEVEERWPRFRAATIAAGYRSTHAIPLRLRGDVIGVLNLFCVDRVTLSRADVDLGQALCDIATVGLLQERTVRRGELLAEQLQSALNSRIMLEQAKGVFSERTGISVDEAFTLMRAHARRHHQQLSAVAAQIIDGTLPAAALRTPADPTNTNA